MDIETRYRQTVRKPCQPVEEIPLEPQDIPDQLKQPAVGQFPEIEKALQQEGIEIPQDWTVEHVLTLTCVGIASMLLEDNKVTASPARLDFVIDDLRKGYDHQLKAHRDMTIGFNVVFNDGIMVSGGAYLPGHDPYYQLFSGLPTICFSQNKSIYSNDRDLNLLDQRKGIFTDQGKRLMRFVATNIREAQSKRQG